VRRDGARWPETLVVKFEDDSTETVKWDGERLWQRFTFHKPVKVKWAELDPERRYYLDANKINDGRTREPDSSASRRWTSDLSSAVEVLYSLVGTL